MFTRYFSTTAALGVVSAALVFVPAAWAQHRGGGHGGGHYAGHASFGGAPVYHGGAAYGYRGYGYGGYGYHHDFDRGRGFYPWYGLGLGLGYGYGYGYYPGYYGYGAGYYDSYPGYDYGAYSSSPGYDYYPGYQVTVQTAPSYQSLYPPDTAYGPAYTSGGTDSTDATVRVRVPDPNASVWIEDTPTRQRGTERVFESPPLQPNQSYHYDIRARWADNGQTYEQTKTVTVHAGDRLTVDFNTPADRAPADQGGQEVLPLPQDRRDQSPDRDSNPSPPPPPDK